MDAHIRTIRQASYISIFGNLALAVLKIAAGFLSGSLALVGDGLDSLTDIVIALMSLYTAVIIARPPDREHPYGHARAETIATSVLAFMIFFTGGQLLVSTIEKICMHKAFAMPSAWAVYVAIISIAGKFALARVQYMLGRKADSELIIANAKNMQCDILTSVSVLIGLAAVFIFQAPLVDKILAALIGIWIMYTAVRIFTGNIQEFMEGIEDETLYAKIFEAVRDTDGATNPHRARIRKIGAKYVVDLDIEVDGKLSVNAAHAIACKIEIRIRGAIPQIYDVVVHVEPYGNIEETECYGRSLKETE